MEDFKLSEHFSFFELTNSSYSDLVATNRIDALKVQKNLKYTAGALEEIRSLLGSPLTVTSGFRNNALNSKVGGSKTSKHRDGLCADIQPANMSVSEAFNIIKKNQDKLHSVRKVIIEGVSKRTWLHVQAKVLATEPIELFSTSDGKTYEKVV